jgi:hypothetical protein
MANLTEDKIYEPGIRQLETTDPLLGGAGGVLNTAVKQLANRTNWLKFALQGFIDTTNVNATHALTLSEILQRLVLVDANGATIQLYLPDSTTGLEIGLTVHIHAFNVNQSQVAITTGGSDIFLTGDSGVTTLYLGNNESIQLVLTSGGWLLLDHKSNLNDIGGVIYRYKQVPNTIVATGQLLNRADYPRLWNYALSLGSSLIDDFSWNSITSNKGFFSTGNGSTTFRVPDLRAMFIRGLDLSAGIDLGRVVNLPGGYEADELKEHDHDYTRPNANGSASGNQVSHPDGPLVNAKSGKTGGIETRPKNIGLLPLIKV